jgi:hypothetical protein
VSLPFTVFPSLVVVPDVMVKSAAITGVAKARQTKADEGLAGLGDGL